MYIYTCRNIEFHLALPMGNIKYWGSFSQQRGVELAVKNSVLKGCYELTLQAYDTNLIRRPESKWKVVSLMGETSDVTCTLLTIGEAPPNKVSCFIFIATDTNNSLLEHLNFSPYTR